MQTQCWQWASLPPSMVGAVLLRLWARRRPCLWPAQTFAPGPNHLPQRNPEKWVVEQPEDGSGSDVPSVTLPPIEEVFSLRDCMAVGGGVGCKGRPAAPTLTCQPLRAAGGRR